jgi:hypothetical protein
MSRRYRRRRVSIVPRAIVPSRPKISSSHRWSKQRAGAPIGRRCDSASRGPSGRTIDVAVGERASVVPRLEGSPTVTLTMPVVSFSCIAGGRLDADRHRSLAVVAGDCELGPAVLANLSYTI